MWFRKEKKPAYDAEKLQPAVRRSYCNRELTLGFLDRETGKFQAICAANSPRELAEFCRQYGLREEDLKTVY